MVPQQKAKWRGTWGTKQRQRLAPESEECAPREKNWTRSVAGRRGTDSAGNVVRGLSGGWRRGDQRSLIGDGKSFSGTKGSGRVTGERESPCTGEPGRSEGERNDGMAQQRPSTFIKRWKIGARLVQEINLIDGETEIELRPYLQGPVNPLEEGGRGGELIQREHNSRKEAIRRRQEIR